ncbi:DNRLRE domain-containing protein [Streptacidiphilus sp. N1-3]|uniref:DNRLRE domain-containing protein n=1 Tax=Streptacidiphilus alkalitolerans TaxID=3342712 RepID=A0ABV6WZT8_9ACTN
MFSHDFISGQGRPPVRRWIGLTVVIALISSLLGGAITGAAAAAPSRALVRASTAAGAAVTVRPDALSAMLAARSQRTRVEVGSERTQTSQTFANPDGSWTTTQYTGPVRVQDREGGWHPIDTTLVQDPKSGDWHPRWAAADISVSNGGAGAFASLTSAARSYAVSWPGRLPQPKVSGDTATYPDVQPGVDLVVTALPTGFSHVLVIRQAPTGPLTFTLPTQTRGLTLSRDHAGHLRLASTAGRLVASAPAPTMWDSSTDPRSGQTARTAVIPTRVVPGASGGHASLVLSPSQTFFADPDLTYPVTVDPAATLAVTTDTWVQNPDYPDSQISSAELKAGTYDGGTDVARSYLKFDVSKYAGKHITDTDLQLYSSYSSTCSTAGAGVQVRRVTTAWDSAAVTWGAQPATTTTDAVTNTAALGYSSACPAGNMHWDVDNIVKSWASGAAPNDGFQVRGASESDSSTWRRFRSANYAAGDSAVEPHLTVTYNSVPGTPTSLSASPLVTNTLGLPRSTSAAPTLSAKSTDADGGNVTLTFEVSHDPAYSAEGTGVLWTGTKTVASGATGSATMPASVIGSTRPHIQWRVRASDGTDTSPWSAYRMFGFNVTPPSPPTVSCPDFSAGAWSAHSGSEVCTLRTPSTDGAGYYWSLDKPNPSTQLADPARNGGNPLTFTVTPSAGWHTLYAKAYDDSYNPSTVTALAFGVGTAGMTLPADQSVTSTTFALQAGSPPGPAKVTFQYRRGTTGAFTAIPAGDVRNGSAAVSWPQAVSPVAGGVQSPALTWSVTRTVADDGLLQIQAVFTDAAGSNPITTAPVSVTLDRLGTGADFGTTQAGPVTVGLQSGNAEVDATDVDINSFGSGLAVSRTFNSLSPSAASLFGPGWTTSLPVAGTSAAWSSLNDAASYAVLTGSDGAKLTFTTGSTTGGTTAYVPQGPAVTAGLDLVKKSGGFILTDAAGTQVTFTSPAGTAAGQYLPATVTQPGGARSTGYVYDTAPGDAAYGKPVLVVAPDADAAAGTAATAACPYPPSASGWGAGCRALRLSYDAATHNVSEVDLVTSDGTGLATTAVAAYGYDTTGRLKYAWDPRITPALKTMYTYDESPGDSSYGRITAVYPAQNRGLPANALQPWLLQYDFTNGDANYGKVLSVSRTHNAANGGATATWSFVYSVPLTTAAGGPVSMDPAATASWGQSDTPVSAVAVFPPGHAPSSSPPTDWTYAHLQYYDADGRQVNEAGYNNGWNISTTEFDTYGNLVRELSAANRAAALAAADTVVAADQLDQQNLYSPDGTLLLDSYGPAHQAVAAGTLQTVRTHTHQVYDEGAPNGDQDSDGNRYDLVTTSTVTASLGAAVPGSADTDARTTQNQYTVGSDTSGWTLHTPLRTVTDPGTGHLALTRAVVYNQDAGRYGGQPLRTETRTPGDPGGTGAGTSRAVYYTAGANSVDAGCGNQPAWADLVCSTGPAAQPATPGLPGLPTTRYTYNTYLEPLTETRTVTAADGSTSTLTTTRSYDAAGRATGTALTSTGAGAGTPVPATRTVYSPDTGLPTDVQNLDSGGSATADLNTGYDDFGNTAAYTDAFGNTTHYSYDLEDRITSRDDGRGTVTLGYNQGSDHSGELNAETDTQAGSFTAAYDPDGNLLTETYPGGTLGSYTYDPTGTPTALAYTNPGWAEPLDDSTDTDAAGNWAARSVLDSTQTYTYDAADRLSTVADVQNGQCTTRGYAYDADSDRTALNTGAPAADGSCQSAAGTSTTHSYDSADRVTDTGYSYDTDGNTTTTPAADTAGGGDLTATYYVNDMLAGQTQGGVSTHWTLDPTGSRQATSTSTADNITYTNTYADDSDTPVVTTGSDGSWTRDVSGPDTDLAAVVTAAGVELQLIDLHGDVMATVDPGTAAITSTATYTEFGAPESTAPPTSPYGWLGGYQRSSDALGGQILMGARAYNPATGRFGSTDPVVGGNANPYDYGNQNPGVMFDPSGQLSFYHHSGNLYIVLSKNQQNLLLDGFTDFIYAGVTAICAAIFSESGVGAVLCGGIAWTIVHGAITAVRNHIHVYKHLVAHYTYGVHWHFHHLIGVPWIKPAWSYGYN